MKLEPSYSTASLVLLTFPMSRMARLRLTMQPLSSGPPDSARVALSSPIPYSRCPEPLASWPRPDQALTDGCAAYAEDGTSNLYLVFLRGPLTGTSVTIGPITTLPGTVSLSDLAVSASGTLYGIDFGSDLYRIDPATGDATDIGPTGYAVNGLVVSPTGTIYASGNDCLITIDPTTGAGTLVGSPQYTSSGDLAFDASGDLYMTAIGTSSGDQLVQFETLDRLSQFGGFDRLLWRRRARRRFRDAVWSDRYRAAVEDKFDDRCRDAGSTGWCGCIRHGSTDWAVVDLLGPDLVTIRRDNSGGPVTLSTEPIHHAPETKSQRLITQQSSTRTGTGNAADR